MKPTDTGVVNIHGKQYQTVALRVSNFRQDHPNWTLTTSIMHRDESCVVMCASIADETGRVLANGHAEEFRSSSSINKTSALENSETSAIGRALAALGYGGTEFCTADELVNAINNKQPAGKGVITPTDGAMESLPTDLQIQARDDADYIRERFEAGDKGGAYEAYCTLKGGDHAYAVAVWGCLKPHSRIRSELKRMDEQMKEAA